MKQQKIDIVILFVILIWMIFFPIKGVFFQLSLYLLPVVVVLYPDTRSFLKQETSTVLILTLCFVLPLFFSDLRAALLFSGKLNSDWFGIFWRLCLLSVSLASACIYRNISVQRLLNYFVVIGSVYSSTGLIGFFTQTALNGRPFSGRANGFIANANPFGFFMAAVSLVVLYCLLHTDKDKYRILFTVAGLFAFLATILSGSRSALLGLVIAVTLMLFLGFNSLKAYMVNHKKLIMVTSLFSFLVIALCVSYFGLMESRLERLSHGDIRLEIWGHYLKQVPDNLFFGTPITSANKAVVAGRSHGPHNMYLGILFQAGLVGLLGLLWGLFWVVKRAIALRCRERIILLPLIVLLCVYCGFNSSLLSNVMTQSVFALVLAMIIIQERESLTTG